MTNSKKVATCNPPLGYSDVEQENEEDSVIKNMTHRMRALRELSILENQQSCNTM